MRPPFTLAGRESPGGSMMPLAARSPARTPSMPADRKQRRSSPDKGGSAAKRARTRTSMAGGHQTSVARPDGRPEVAQAELEGGEDAVVYRGARPRSADIAPNLAVSTTRDRQTSSHDQAEGGSATAFILDDMSSSDDDGEAPEFPGKTLEACSGAQANDEDDYIGAAATSEGLEAPTVEDDIPHVRDEEENNRFLGCPLPRQAAKHPEVAPNASAKESAPFPTALSAASAPADTTHEYPLIMPDTPVKDPSVEQDYQAAVGASLSPSVLAIDHLLDADHSIMLDNQCLQPTISSLGRLPSSILSAFVEEEDEEEEAASGEQAGGEPCEQRPAGAQAPQHIDAPSDLNLEADQTLHLDKLETAALEHVHVSASSAGDGHSAKGTLDHEDDVSGEHASILVASPPPQPLPTQAISPKKTLAVEMAVQEAAVAASPCPTVDTEQVAEEGGELSVELGRADLSVGNLSANMSIDMLQAQAGVLLDEDTHREPQSQEITDIRIAEDTVCTATEIPNLSEITKADVSTNDDHSQRAVVLAVDEVLELQSALELSDVEPAQLNEDQESSATPPSPTNQVLSDSEQGPTTALTPAKPEREVARQTPCNNPSVSAMQGTPLHSQTPMEAVSESQVLPPAGHAVAEEAMMWEDPATTMQAAETPVKQGGSVAVTIARESTSDDSCIGSATIPPATKRRTLNRGAKAKAAASDHVDSAAALLSEAELVPVAKAVRNTRRSSRALPRTASADSLTSQSAVADTDILEAERSSIDKGKKRAAPMEAPEQQPVRKVGRPRKVATEKERTPEKQTQAEHAATALPAKRHSKRIAAVSGLPQPKARAAPSGLNDRTVTTAVEAVDDAAVPSTSAAPAMRTVRARAMAAAKGPLPSPRRVPSPEKKQKSRVDGQQELDSPYVVAARAPKVQLSPRRVPSPLKGPSAPGRAGGPVGPRANSIWKAQPTSATAPRSIFGSQFSPDAAKRVARSVFPAAHDIAKAGSIFAGKASASSSSLASQPSSSQAAAIATVSPIKGLGQRSAQPGSPVLLELAIDPGALVLGAPPARTTTVKAEPLETSDEAAQLLPIRDLSLPPSLAQPKTSAAQAAFGRRAFSAQPPASPRRVEVPSPRRVLPKGKPAFVTKISTAPQKLDAPLSPRRVVLPERVPKAPIAVASTSRIASADPIGSANRSGASALPVQRPTRVSARKSISTAPAAAASQGQTAQPGPPTLNPSQLAALTAKHTTINKRNYNVHNVTVVHKDEDRPPSPTSKIRKVIDGSSSSPKSVKALLAANSEEDAPRSSNAGAATVTTSGKRPHFMAAGDDSPYKSPVKAVSSEEPEAKRAKIVKWDRGLLQPVTEARTPRRAKAKAADLSRSKKVYRTAGILDAHGNVPDSKTPLSPLVPRVQVPISKIVYRDDPQEEEDA